MPHWVKGSVFASVLLTGCSLFSAEQAESPQEGEVNKGVVLKVPAGLAQPAKPGRYDIPSSVAKHTEADTRSPALVLATASSSRVEEGDKAVRVWFDRNDLTGELLPFLNRMLHAQFAEQGVELTEDAAGLSYTTGWISRSQESGFWFWTSDEQQEQARYRINLEPRPHGRSASMTVTMLEHQYFVEQAKLQNSDVRRQEIALLNQIIDRIGKEEIVIALANKAKAPDVSLEPGLDAQGNPALLTTQNIDVTWSQLEALFNQLNLTVTDRNRSVFTYYLSYEKPETGLWSRLWGADPMPVLPVAEGEYQLVLSRASEQTVLSLRNQAGEHLSPETILALHQPFVEAIRLAKIEL